MLDIIVMVVFGILFFWLIGSTDREECRLECNCSKCRKKKKVRNKNSWGFPQEKFCKY